MLATTGGAFGKSVAIDGDTIVVGAYFDSSTAFWSGAAFVFIRGAGDVWTQQQKLTASDGGNIDVFGSAVAISGNTVVVGADLVNLGQGSAYTFVRSGNVWTQQDHLIASDGVLGNDFGYAVAIDSRIIVVGALNTSSGPAPAKRNHHGQLGGKPLLAHVLSAFARVLSVPCSHAPLGVRLRRHRA